MAWIRLWITFAWMTNRSCLSAWNNSRTFAGAFPLLRTRLSSSFQVCLFGFKSGNREGQGSQGRCCWRGTVWCCMLHGVWHCRVELQCYTTFDARMKQQKKKKKAFLFLNSIFVNRGFRAELWASPFSSQAFDLPTMLYCADWWNVRWFESE